MHLSREKAKEQADFVARMHVGTTIDLFKLKSVGSIKYPSSPTISGEMCWLRAASVGGLFHRADRIAMASDKPACNDQRSHCPGGYF
jgi:hypothetical protein